MLSEEELTQYHHDGFLIVHDLFTEEELEPVIHAIEEKVEALAEALINGGAIDDRYESEGFLTRLTRLEQAFPGAATLIHTGGVLPKAFAELWSSKKLLDMMEQILGPDIAGHPVWNLRSKTPHNALATVPWHQDTAYLAAGSEFTFQPTAWIPLVDADEVNGCMEVCRPETPLDWDHPVVYPHKLENTRGRKDSWYLYVNEADLPRGEIVTCTMNKGSVLLLNNLIPHRSTENYSESIRWSIDLRWQRPGEVSGMEGIKDPIVMRTARNPNYRPNWEEWGAISRQVGLHDVLQERERPISKEDARVTGPWMERWKT